MKWFIRGRKGNIDNNIVPNKIIKNILEKRGIIEEKEINQFLFGTINDLHSPFLLNGLNGAIEMLMNNKETKIRIIGDYDCDGINSTFILVDGLKECGFTNIDYYIPDRHKDGYGINVSIIEKAKEENIEIIITCDNGIAAVEAIDKAKQLGIKVIVTDHHNVAIDDKNNKILPNADVIINPKNCNYPFKEICGAAVAFKVIQGLFIANHIDIVKSYSYIPFVAFATICDVMPLIDENRLFVKYGLPRLPYIDNPGLRALIKETDLEEKEINSYHIGFILGPCINAASRVADVNIAMDLLFTNDVNKATKYAKELVTANKKRQELTELAINHISEQIENKKNKIIVEFNGEIEESIAGIVAGKIKEKYYRPTIILTNSNDENIAKGSGRSIEEYDMFANFLPYKNTLLSKFGGHPLAAGMSLKKDNIDILRKELNKNCNISENLVEKLMIDLQLPLKSIDEELINDLLILEPFGKDNPKPCFGIKNVSIGYVKQIGSDNQHISFSCKYIDNNNFPKFMKAILFNKAEEFEQSILNKYSINDLNSLYTGKKFINMDLVFYPSINEYNGKKTIQLIVSDIR